MSGLLDEFSSREACSSSAFSSSTVLIAVKRNYCWVLQHGDVFVIVKNSEQCNFTPSQLSFLFLHYNDALYDVQDLYFDCQTTMNGKIPTK